MIHRCGEAGIIDKISKGDVLSVGEKKRARIRATKEIHRGGKDGVFGGEGSTSLKALLFLKKVHPVKALERDDFILGEEKIYERGKRKNSRRKLKKEEGVALKGTRRFASFVRGAGADWPKRG